MTLKEMVHQYKIKTGCSDSELARRCNVSRSTVARWSSGEIKKVNDDTAEILSHLLGYNITPILMGMDTTIRLPILGYAKAGYDLFAEENYLGEEETTLKERENGDYYLRITGNSMSSIGIMDGSLVLVRQCDSIPSGKIAVVMIDQEVTVKRVIYKKGMMILEAANPDVESRYFTPQEIKELPVKIIGQVLSCRTSF